MIVAAALTLWCAPATVRLPSPTLMETHMTCHSPTHPPSHQVTLPWTALPWVLVDLLRMFLCC